MPITIKYFNTNYRIITEEHTAFSTIQRLPYYDDIISINMKYHTRLPSRLPILPNSLTELDCTGSKINEFSIKFPSTLKKLNCAGTHITPFNI